MENEFKLPSKAVEEVKREADANVTVLVEARTNCWYNNIYYSGSQKFMCDKKDADDFVKANLATII